MTLLRTAVIGLGIGGRIHLDAIPKTKNLKAVACVAPHTDANFNVAKHYSLPLYPSLEECLSCDSVDCIIIASPNDCHLAHATYCIEQKIPCLLEKPLAGNLDDASQIVDIYNLHNFEKVLIGHHRAHSILLSKSVDIIRSGSLGELVGIQGFAQFYKPDSYFASGPWRTQAGGGPILINMIHEIDSLRRLIGEVTSVYCVTSSKNRKFSVEDSAAILFEFANGAIGTFFLSDCVPSSKSWELTSGENPAYPRQPSDCYYVSGTHGSLSIPSLTVQRYSSLDRSWWNTLSSLTPDFLSNDPIVAQLEHFSQVVHGVADPKVTVLDGYNNMLVADAILKSSQKGIRVELN